MQRSLYFSCNALHLLCNQMFTAAGCEILEILISSGARLDAKSVEGTPLQYASVHGNMSAVKILLQHHADVSEILLVYPYVFF